MPDLALPRAGYVICTEPRSGSSVLCQHLESTGLLGRPRSLLRYVDALEHPTVSDDVANPLHSATTENGVCGFKMFSAHFDLVQGQGWLKRIPDVQFVHLEREDLLGQAISMVKAMQTKHYRHSDTPGDEIAYDEAKIAFVLQRLALGHARWRAFFARNGIRPLYLSYEAVSGDPGRAVKAIAERVGIDLGDVVSASAMRIQRDATNDDWRERFLRGQSDIDRLEDLTAPAVRNTLATTVRTSARRMGLSRRSKA